MRGDVFYQDMLRTGRQLTVRCNIGTGPLLTFVFARHPSNWVQYCTDPRTLPITVNETHFIGFSSSGIDNASFVFMFDGVDRSKDIFLCTHRGLEADNDPTGLSLPLRAGIAGNETCGFPPHGCDRYGGYIGSTRYFDRTITAAQMRTIYDAERTANLP